MTYGHLVQKTWNENFLFSALVELTYRCNLDCYFCYNDLSLKGRPMTRSGYARFFEDLRDMQTMHLVLTGGEPLAHPDFFPIGAKARELGFVIRLKSNGHALRGDLARRIQTEVDPFVVEVSLHGATPETHDRQTRVPGSFERLVTNLEEMVALGFRVKLNSTLTVWNESEIEGMFRLADRLGLRLQVDPEVSPRDDGDKSVCSISASREGIRRLFQLQARRAADARKQPQGGDRSEVGRSTDETMPAGSDKHCGAAASGIAVDPFGNVYPCVQWRWPAGNLHETSIKEIWSGSRTLAEVRSLSVEAKKLVESYGDKGPMLRLCPGLAWASTGNPLSVPETAVRKMEVAEEVKKEGLIPLPVVP